MPSGTGGSFSAGIVLQTDFSCAVILCRDTVAPVLAVRAVVGDVETLIQSVNAAAGKKLGAVTVDISPVLIDSIVNCATDLPPIAVIRVVPRPASDPRLARSPADLIERLIAHRFTVAGGHDLLGNELCPLDRPRLAQVCALLATSGVVDVAIVAAGSQARPVHEREVADAVQGAIPRARISVASDFGGQGLAAREATVALDCVLGPLAEHLIERCERALAVAAPGVQLRIARGDGGCSTPSRTRALPVVALGAADAMQLCGAAYLEGRSDCRVLLPRAGGQVAGDVRHGLVAVRSGELADFGVALVVPTAALTPDPGNSPGGESGRVSEAPVVLATRDPSELACIGAAVSRPTSWLDEFAFIESAAELEQVRSDVLERANAMVIANGAAPGSAQLAEMSTVAVPYSPPGTIRIRVRVTGDPDTDPRRVAVVDRLAP